MGLGRKSKADKNRLLRLIKKIHLDCFCLCKIALGKYLPTAGDIGVFCRTENDYRSFLTIRDEITEASDNPKQKYFRLRKPIVIPGYRGVPKTSYTYLYVRKPDPETPQAGDVDFVLTYQDFGRLKARLIKGENIPGARIYNRPGWDMIELAREGINALAYISYPKMAEKVRVKFD